VPEVQVGVDGTVIGETGQRYWLLAAVGPDTNRSLHVGLFPMRTTGIAETSLFSRVTRYERR
jgi:transposase-like protein